MAAFDKICSGFDQLDKILDYIRLGDNVVWQVPDVSKFRMFAEPFAAQAIKDGRKVIYIRFAQHEPILRDLEGIQIYEFNPDEGFEAFAVAIHDRIAREGKEVFYVFDCLSELQSVWYTDLMMGNFFRVTCPFLFQLDTVAYFPLLRGVHSFDATARIRDTTQLLLDVFSGEDAVYVHPLKVWNRYSAQMFQPYCRSEGQKDFVAVTGGIGMSRYYQAVHTAAMQGHDQNYDSYDRFFNEAQQDCKRGVFSKETEELIIDSTMTKDQRLKRLVKEYFKPEDYFLLRSRMIGSGAIGGKACGMLLARKIAETDIQEFRYYSEPHDSFYIGSDVFYTYIVSNGCWDLRIRQRTEEGYFEVASELKERLLCGEFPAKIREQFLNLMEYFGQNPCIVRSSSFLEDGFGNAFAGKYESVFCVNQGSPKERLEAFEQAVRTVYASTMDYSALEYRRLRGLEKKDEQMAILVQRVSGDYYGSFFLPNAAGVGYSHSAYQWYPDMDPEAGMLRIVVGLGTKAVDRTREDYPRIVNLDRPSSMRLATVEERHKYSQRNIDVLDCEENQIREIPLSQLLSVMPAWFCKDVLEHDTEAEYRLRQMGRYQDVWFVSCQKLLEDQRFTSLMQKVLQTLAKVYKNPVDIEYTVNRDETGEFVMNLLQCRPLYLGKQGEAFTVTKEGMEKVLFELRESSMGASGSQKIDVVVLVDPVGYYQYPYRKKYDVAAAVGRINRYYQNTGKHLMLLTPGRIGTTSPELGVPVTFGDISGFSVICEISDRKAGYMPELSYGSHMFQDLVEAEIRYGAVWNDRRTLEYHPDMLDDYEDMFLKICPEHEELSGIVRMFRLDNLEYRMDAVTNYAVCGINC